MTSRLESALRFARVTRHLPWLKGLGMVRSFYDAVLPFRQGWTLRVDDFDGDLSMDVDPRDIVGINVWHRPGLFEQHERKLFCSTIRHGSVVLDIGANIGIYTLLAAKRGARVFAIEADPDNARTLRHHVRLNGFEDRVTVFEMAAVDEERHVTLYRDQGNSGHSNLFSGVNAISVPGATIDSLSLPQIDVCKIDIEGAEVHALRGMSQTIRNSPHLFMLIEYCAKFGHTEELMSFIRSHFSQVWVAGKGSLPPGTDAPKFCNLWLSGPCLEHASSR